MSNKPIILNSAEAATVISTLKRAAYFTDPSVPLAVGGSLQDFMLRMASFLTLKHAEAFSSDDEAKNERIQVDENINFDIRPNGSTN